MCVFRTTSSEQLRPDRSFTIIAHKIPIVKRPPLGFLPYAGPIVAVLCMSLELRVQRLYGFVNTFAMLNKSCGLVANTSPIKPKNFRRVLSTAWKTSGMATLKTIKKIMNPIELRIPNIELFFKGDTTNSTDKSLCRSCLLSPLHGKQYENVCNYVTRWRESLFLLVVKNVTLRLYYNMQILIVSRVYLLSSTS
jgi:hypothetical protein